MQFYRLVTNDFPADHKCLGPPPTHWTRTAEEYCWGDAQPVMLGKPADTMTRGAQTVDEAWTSSP